MSESAGKQERLARGYDAEIVPAYAGRFAGLVLRAQLVRPGARVVEAGCATGHLTAELARRFDAASSISALDPSAPLVALARARLGAGAGGRVSLRAAPLWPLPLPDASADVVVSNLAAAEAADPAAAVGELARVAAPGALVAITVPLRGTWAEFVDIYRDVLRENGKPDAAAALDRQQEAMPDGEAAARWLERAGLQDVRISVDRWEVLFKSAREFFFAPLIEQGPLSAWKQVAGRGDELQDLFFFTKEAIDTYYRGSAFAVTVVGAAVTGRKPV